jgi:hypothetical protein
MRSPQSYELYVNSSSIGTITIKPFQTHPVSANDRLIGKLRRQFFFGKDLWLSSTMGSIVQTTGKNTWNVRYISDTTETTATVSVNKVGQSQDQPSNEPASTTTSAGPLY